MNGFSGRLLVRSVAGVVSGTGESSFDRVDPAWWTGHRIGGTGARSRSAGWRGDGRPSVESGRPAMPFVGAGLAPPRFAGVPEITPRRPNPNGQRRRPHTGCCRRRGVGLHRENLVDA